jgi:hypothetical protein
MLGAMQHAAQFERHSMTAGLPVSKFSRLLNKKADLMIGFFALDV